MSKGSVLISGSAGGIGSATAERFLAGGYEVLGVDLVRGRASRTRASDRPSPT